MHHDDAYTSEPMYWWEVEDTTLTDDQIWGEPTKPEESPVTQGGGD